MKKYRKCPALGNSNSSVLCKFNFEAGQFFNQVAPKNYLPLFAPLRRWLARLYCQAILKNQNKTIWTRLTIIVIIVNIIIIIRLTI